MEFYDVIDNFRIVIVIIGIALLVAGFYLHQLAVAIPGFIVFAIIGLLIGHFENHDEPLLTGLVSGIIGALIAIFLEKVIIFLLGASALILLLFFINDDPPALLIIIMGLGGGITALSIYKFFIVIITSIMGSFLFCGGTDTIDTSLPVILTFIGIAIQYGLLWAFPGLREKTFDED